MTYTKILEFDSTYRNRLVDESIANFKLRPSENNPSISLANTDKISNEVILRRWRPFNFALREFANMVFEYPVSASGGTPNDIINPLPFFYFHQPAVGKDGVLPSPTTKLLGFSKNSTNASGYIKDFTEGRKKHLVSSIMLQPYFTKGSHNIPEELSTSTDLNIEGGQVLSEQTKKKPAPSSNLIIQATSVFEILNASGIYTNVSGVSGKNNFNIGHGILNTEDNYYVGCTIQLENRDTHDVIAVATIIKYEFLGNDICRITLSNPLGYGGLDYTTASGSHVLKIVDPSSNVDNIISKKHSNEFARIFVPGGAPEFSYTGMYLYSLQSNEQINASGLRYPKEYSYKILSHEKSSNIITIDVNSQPEDKFDEHTEFFIREKEPIYTETYSKHGVLRAYSEERIAHTLFGQNVSGMKVGNIESNNTSSILANEMKSTHEFNIFDKSGLLSNSTDVERYQKNNNIVNTEGTFVTTFDTLKGTQSGTASGVFDSTVNRGVLGKPITAKAGDILEMSPRNYTGAHSLLGTFMLHETDPSKIIVNNFSFTSDLTNIESVGFKTPVNVNASGEAQQTQSMLKDNSISSFQDFVNDQYKGCTIQLIWDHYQDQDGLNNDNFTNVVETKKIKSWLALVDGDPRNTQITLDTNSMFKYTTVADSLSDSVTNGGVKNGGMFHIIPTIEHKIIEKIVDAQLVLTSPDSIDVFTDIIVSSSPNKGICNDNNVVNKDDYYTGLYITITKYNSTGSPSAIAPASNQYNASGNLNAIEAFSFIITRHKVIDNVSRITIEPRFPIDEGTNYSDLASSSSRWTSGITLTQHLVNGCTCVIKSCKLFEPFTRTPVYENDFFSILKPTKINTSRIIMNDQMTGRMYQDREVTIKLQDIILPNSLLKCSKGGYITQYPFIYVILSGSNINEGRSTLSNNPNIKNGLRFKVIIDNYVDDITTKFVVLRSSAELVCNMSFQSDIQFQVRMPDGDLFETIDEDTSSPYEPKKDIQISATFVIQEN
jgi:hypothetical protein